MQKFEKHFATRSQIEKHNKEVKEVMEAYLSGKPKRVPFLLSGISPYMLLYQNEDYSFKEYHENPQYQLKLQAQSFYYTNNIIFQDEIMDDSRECMAIPDYNVIMDAGYWGCPTTIKDRAQPRQTHLFKGVKIDPDELGLPDPFKDNMMKDVCRYYVEMKKLVKDYRPFGVKFSDKIDIQWPLITLGIFNTAVQLMGTDFFLELYDDPQYAKKLLNRIADGFMRRSNAWMELGIENGEYCCGVAIEDTWKGIKATACNNNIVRHILWDHGIDMISIDQYNDFLVPVYERIKAGFGQDKYDNFIEHCGHGEDVIRFKHRYFGINHFNNLTADLIDIEKLRHDLGDEVELGVAIPGEVLTSGPIERIYKEVKELLRPGVKGNGRLYFMLWANFLVPIENHIALYQAVKEYGSY